jgi:hypothetical protein
MFVSLFLKPCTASAGDRCFVALQAPPNRAPVRVSMAEITAVRKTGVRHRAAPAAPR